MQRTVVARPRTAHAAVEAAHGLDVVAEHLGPRAEHGRERLLLDPEEVGREQLDGAAGSFAFRARVTAAN